MFQVSCFKFQEKVGQKKVIQQNQEETIKETEKIEEGLKKASKLSPKADRVSEGITLTNSRGQVLASKSAGSVGFKGTKKATSFASSRVSEAIANICKKLTIEKIEVFIKGIGAGRESAVRTLVNQGLNVVSIKDVTPIPHNGCRPRKVRRV